MKSEYRICSRCVMDSSMPGIHFDERGICNYCAKHHDLLRNMVFNGSTENKKLDQLMQVIKNNGRGKKYDCLIGLSGGADCSFAAYEIVKMGLRPLGVHIDNGWNAEFAENNIKKLVRNLNIDLHTYTIDFDEFKDLQLSFFKASVPNIEILTDHAIKAYLYKVASKEGIKYIISGSNIVTEGILPQGWGHTNMDGKHIRAIHKRFGSMKINTFPILTVPEYLYYSFYQNIRKVSVLNYMNYVKNDAIKLLEEEIGWERYPGKHNESIFTRFFQGYILPKKFNVDKRRAHLSSLICSGQITRDQALEELSHDPYPSTDSMLEDKKIVLDKLNLQENEFDEIMSLPVKSHHDYPSNKLIFKMAPFILSYVRRFGVRTTI